MFGENTDSDTLLNVKYIFILAAIWRLFFLLAIAMQIEQLDFVEAAH